jgi:hypothetical protein
MRFLAFFLLAASSAIAAPSAVSTFHSIGLYWGPEGGSESNAARVEFREKGNGAWRQGLDLWFDARNAEYRGSLVELEPGTAYEIRLSLSSGQRESLVSKTWDEKFLVKRTVEVQPDTKRLVIKPEDSGDEKQGYVVFTAPPGRNVIEGNDADESCVLVRQGAHHVIIRGLVLRNCKRYGVLIQRQGGQGSDTQTHDIVIEANEIVGWGGFENQKRSSGLADSDGAIHCNYYRETDDAKRPDRIVIQGNRIHDPRHGANPWRSARGRLHPYGPLGVMFERCGQNHVIRYNDIGSANGNHYKDGLGGGENFSAAGFPWADSDIYGNRISNVYDDAIEAEGANRNVRIWGNYVDRVFVAIANAPVTSGPLYVWRNVSQRTAGMFDPELRRERPPFIKAGSRDPVYKGGRAYYFHNTALEPSSGIAPYGGPLSNYVGLNNLFGPGERPGRAERIPNFNDRYPRPDAGARQSGAPPMRYGVEAYKADRSAH